MKNTLLICLSVILLSCHSKDMVNDSFTLTATLKGIENNTLIELKEAQGTLIDTIRLQNGKAQFSGKISKPKRVLLSAKESNNYAYFWIEPGNITFEAEDGKFRTGKVLGSKTQEKDDAYDKRIKPFDDIMNEVDTFVEKNQDQLTKSIVDSLRTVYTKAERDQEKETQSFIAEHPRSLVSLYLLDFYKTTYGKKIVKPLYENFDGNFKTHPYGASIQKYLELNDEPKIGEAYRDVTLMDRNGEMISISDIDAKYLLIEFWSSRCAPCRITNPKLVKIYEKYQGKGFEIYGISLDTNQTDWLKAIDKDGLSWTNVVDLDGDNGDTALRYGISAIPDNYLVDSEGKIMARKIWSEDLESLLATLLP